MGPLSRRIADRIADKYPNALVILLDNKKLAAFNQQQGSSPDDPAPSTSAPLHPFEVFSRDGGKGSGWKREPQGLLSVAGGAGSLAAMRETFFSLFSQQAHRALVDFDDHLDDLSKDYLNSGLKTLGKMALPGQMR